MASRPSVPTAMRRSTTPSTTTGRPSPPGSVGSSEAAVAPAALWALPTVRASAVAWTPAVVANVASAIMTMTTVPRARM